MNWSSQFLLDHANQIDCLQVSFGGGLGGLVVDTIGHNFSQKYHNRVIQVRFMPSLIATNYNLYFFIINLHNVDDLEVTITKFNYAA